MTPGYCTTCRRPATLTEVGWRPDGYRHNPPPAKPLNVTPASPDVLATLRGLVSSAKAGLCPCGVNPLLCADHDPRKTEGESK